MNETNIKLKLSDLLIEKHRRLFKSAVNHEYTHYSLYGGRGGVKSTAISVIIVTLIVRNRDVHAVIFRKVSNTLRDSVYAQISFAISMLGLDDYFKKTVSPMEITFMPTKQKILFRGLDEPHKIKSIKPPFGYFGITWFEELDQYSGREEIRTVLQSTMRGKGGKFWNFESFNPPISQNSWANRDLHIKRDGRLTVQTSYLEVPQEWLSEQFFIEAETLKEINPRAYEHEYMGVPTGTGGNVFENVILRDITDDEYNSFERFYYGVDFGWFPDPFAYVKCAYNHNQRILYILDEQVEYKKNNRDTAALLLNEKKLTRDDLIICDSAEPKSIADYREYKLYAIGAEKSAGSLNYSMKWLQGLTKIVIDAKCVHTGKEFLEYEYERTRDNELISGYPDKNNHYYVFIITYIFIFVKRNI